MAGRTTVSTATQAVDSVAQARRQAKAMVEQAQSRLVEGAGELRSRVETGVAQAGLKLDEALSPLVAKFVPGKAKRPARRGRKPVAKKATRRPARKPAATRRARKG
jgi:hypothetical protein